MKWVDIYLYLQHFCGRTRKIPAVLKLEEGVSSKERISPSQENRRASGSRNIVYADWNEI